MAESKETRSGTYRCPVCGHRDAAELEVDKESIVIPCSYCNTSLEVSSRGADSIRFSVQVSEQPAAR
jgi:transcription elongation factor Elf1